MKRGRNARALACTGTILLFCRPAPVPAAETYRETWRPQFHFSPASHWMNDPNGLVFYDGELHLFYQYNPSGNQWGNMSWGHASSHDLVHWEHLPVALRSDPDYLIFSGSVVLDTKNSSGLGQGGKAPLVALYTGNSTHKPLQNQQLAFSNDGGRTWTKYKQNPVLDPGETDFRDPKVFWHEPTKRWVMAVAWPLQHQVRFYTSTNLREWKHASDFGPAGATDGVWECPDLFPLKLENANRAEKWVLLVSVGAGAPAGGSGMQYFVGEFNGVRFTLDRSFPRSEPEFVPEADLVVDFEGSDYRGWRVSGDAFGDGPAHGNIGTQQHAEGFRGKGFVNTFQNGDAAQGTLTSPEFEINNDFISFLIGGGNHAGKTCFNLLVESNVIRTATGKNSEQLTWNHWDVHDLRGKKGQFEIVDRENGPGGHVLLDEIVLADAAVRPAVQRAWWLDYGPDFYAGVTWNDVPRRDGRRLLLGWMNNWRYASDLPTTPWRGAMSIPRELTLWQSSDGFRLIQQPIDELRRLREKSFRLKNASRAQVNEMLRRENVSAGLWEIEAEIQLGKVGVSFGFKLAQRSNQSTIVRWDTEKRTVSVNRTGSGRTDFHPSFSDSYEAPLEIKDSAVRLHLFLDTSSLELFANDGSRVLTTLLFPAVPDRAIELWSSNDSLSLRELNVWRLKPAVPIAPARESRR